MKESFVKQPANVPHNPGNAIHVAELAQKEELAAKKTREKVQKQGQKLTL
ncbi:hypothetical protein [Spiroplasma endosymbiont of Nebria brevicollis]